MVKAAFFDEFDLSVKGGVEAGLEPFLDGGAGEELADVIVDDLSLSVGVGWRAFMADVGAEEGASIRPASF